MFRLGINEKMSPRCYVFFDTKNIVFRYGPRFHFSNTNNLIARAIKFQEFRI